VKTSASIVRWSKGSVPLLERDELAVEEPLEIRIDTQPAVVTMRTPGHDDELAAGLLFSEGLVARREDIRAIRTNRRNRTGNSLDVFLSPDKAMPFSALARRGFISSSCGVCGKESIRALHKKFKPLTSRTRIGAELLAQLPERLRAAQATFARTGGLHAAGIFSNAGELLVAREDIGRHNAVDKVIGHGLLNGLLPFAGHVLVVSGRLSFEIVQKALAARVPILCAVSAPSSLAVEFARTNRQTLVGFARGERLNVYSGKQRVDFRGKGDE
jgi:FdhD protein